MVSINGTASGIYIKYVRVLRENHRTEMKMLLLKKNKENETLSYKKLDEYFNDLTEEKNKLEAKIQHFFDDKCINKRLCEINDAISELEEQELIDGILKKNDVYKLLKEKTDIIKKLDDNKYNVGISLYFLEKIEDTKIKETITKMIFLAENKNDINDIHIDNPWVNIIFGILQKDNENGQLKITSIEDEILIIPKDRYKDVNHVINEYPKVANKIQFKNAERQIRQFGNEEEEEFEKLQKQYLELISKINEIKKKYSDYKITEDEDNRNNKDNEGQWDNKGNGNEESDDS